VFRTAVVWERRWLRRRARMAFRDGTSAASLFIPPGPLVAVMETVRYGTHDLEHVVGVLPMPTRGNKTSDRWHMSLLFLPPSPPSAFHTLRPPCLPAPPPAPAPIPSFIFHFLIPKVPLFLAPLRTLYVVEDRQWLTKALTPSVVRRRHSQYSSLANLRAFGT